MIHIHFRARARIAFLSASAVAVLANCSGPLDYDLRGIGGGFSTADAATQVATEARPQPDNRGIIFVASLEEHGIITVMAKDV